MHAALFRLFATLPLYLFLSLEALPPSSVLYLRLSSLHLSVGAAAAAACMHHHRHLSLLAHSVRVHTSIGSSALRPAPHESPDLKPSARTSPRSEREPSRLPACLQLRSVHR